MTKKTELNFEIAIKQLEEIINDMENGNIELEQSMNKYKTGMELVKFCQEKLRDVEQKVKILDQESHQLKEFSAE